MSEIAAEHHNYISKGSLLGAAALIAFALVTVSMARVTGIGTVHTDHAAPVESWSLRFEDRPDGGIAVINPDSGSVLTVVEPGTDGFIRTVLRSLAYDRQRQHIGSGPAFKLTKWSDRHATLDDPSTGRSIDLVAFGKSNMQAFANLMIVAGGKP
jgi:putative photosynthetic complex assembly protein